MASEIGIATVLAQVDLSAVGQPFTMEFVKADGSLRKIRAQKGHKKEGASAEGSSFKYRIKGSGNILVRDLDSGEDRAIKISRIISFNGQKVKH